MYPDTNLVVLLDGTSTHGKLQLFNDLPAEPLVVKTYDESVGDRLVNRFQAKPALSFVSYTASSPRAGHSIPADVIESSVPDDEIIRILGHNGYERAELSRYFADGARWFGIRSRGQIVSACFVFRNFETVWEIGGVFTEPNHRRMGHTRKVVTSALNHLLANGFTPRYQVRSDNMESIRLAETIGLKEFLHMDHYLVGTNSDISP
jgi:GNAT superfamily N-acetyltransferase